MTAAELDSSTTIMEDDTTTKVDAVNASSTANNHNNKEEVIMEQREEGTALPASTLTEKAMRQQDSGLSSFPSTDDEGSDTAPATAAATTTTTSATEPPSPWTENCTGLKVMFLSSDTGGGHRASAESLGNQFVRLYPGSEYILLDIMTDHAPSPYNELKAAYKHLSAHPNQWNFVYKMSNTTAFSKIQDVHWKLMMERAVRKRILQIGPDVVVSVHPMMNSVPVVSCQKISSRTNRHIPMFTVVTDLGSAHSSWFDKGVEKLFVASDQISKLAQERKKVPKTKLVMSGLPIRHDFAVQAEKLGDRFSQEGKDYQRTIKEKLNVDSTLGKTVLVMGGGEGVGSLSNIVNAIYCELYLKGIDGQILVVCGRNEKLKQELENRDWNSVLHESTRVARSKLSMSACADGTLLNSAGSSLSAANLTDYSCGSAVAAVGCVDSGGMTNRLRKILSSPSLTLENPLSMLPYGNSSSSDKNKDTTKTTTTTASTEEDENAKEKKEQEEEKTEAMATDAADDTNQNLVTIESGEDLGIDQTSSILVPKGLATTDGDDDATNGKKIERGESYSEAEIASKSFVAGHVSVIGLGFVTNMAEYMVATDVLVTKAGPGTIAEAASLSLPVMLTSFLPGQEEGNVDFVVDGKFGAYSSDRDPAGIAEEVASWLLDEYKLETLSKAAKKAGKPNAAAEIVQHIGESTLRWKEHNEELAAIDVKAGITRDDAPSPEPTPAAVAAAAVQEGEVSKPPTSPTAVDQGIEVTASSSE
mmetsp:Transcript_1918/g.2695  ORF Transcript_1918/g.2695 Transcript_1918/m.2695 type:complete len:759 (-) Transcript_1918:122-2398(-)